jgi:hypothetical protein
VVHNPADTWQVLQQLTSRVGPTAHQIRSDQIKSIQLEADELHCMYEEYRCVTVGLTDLPPAAQVGGAPFSFMQL